VYDYTIFFVIDTLKATGEQGLELFKQQYWILGPILFGFIVTVFTWKVLYPKDERKAAARPSLQLGKVVAVLNGTLIFLYLLLYHLKSDRKAQKME